MAILDALSILGAGIGRGYRGSQEVQRQIAEAKRKALLEERDQAIREQTARAQVALAQAQTAGVNQETGEKGRQINRAQTPITSGGAPLRMNVLKQDVDLPGTMESLTDQGQLFRQLEDQRFKDEHPDYFTNYPPAGTSAAALKNSPEARGKAYIEQILTGNPPMSLGEDPDEYTARTTQMMRMKLNFLREIDPEALNELFQKVTKSTSRDTSSGKDSTNTNSRFKVVVKP